MLPVVSPDEMAAIDTSATEPVEVLIGRAGRATARCALELLGGAYGRRVAVIVGKGNNGNDGRVAATELRRRGVAVELIDATQGIGPRHDLDLVIDAAYGTGFHGEWDPPEVGDIPVLALDIPSGVDGLTGRVAGRVLAATATITMVTYKPGLLFSPGRELAGAVRVADIGLDVPAASAYLVEPADVARWVPPRAPDAHKWRASVWVVAGSPGMLGAAHLAAGAAMRSGAGMVRLGIPGAGPSPTAPAEVVGRSLPTVNWSSQVLADLSRFHALAIGPGLGREDQTAAEVRSLVAAAPVPTVVDGDALVALAWSSDGPATVLRRRAHPTVLTPHDGEFALLRGAHVGPDRMAAARGLACDLGAVVLLKGPCTVVADPEGRTLLVVAGDQRLATAGTGDVLTGIIGALLARGVGAFEAAAAGAWLHGRAAALGSPTGLVASDLVPLVARALEALDDGR